MIVDPAEHIGKPSLRIGAVELGGADQRKHDGGAVTAAVPGHAATLDVDIVIDLILADTEA
jgi:hypothetical protein